MERRRIWGLACAACAFTACGPDASSRLQDPCPEPPPRLTDFGRLPDGTLLQDYRAEIRSEGGNGPRRYEVTAGEPPLGLTVEQEGGSAILSGRPTWEGDYEFTLAVIDSCGLGTGERLFMRVEQAFEPLRIETQSIPTAELEVPFRWDFEASGGAGRYRWSSSDELPRGLELSEFGVLKGRPSREGTYPFELTVVDAAGQSASRSYTVAVRGGERLVWFESDFCPPAIVRTPYRCEVSCLGGRPPYAMEVAGSSPLPEPLQLVQPGAPLPPPFEDVQPRANTANLVATFTSSGTHAFRLFVTDSSVPAFNDSESFFLEVRAAE